MKDLELLEAYHWSSKCKKSLSAWPPFSKHEVLLLLSPSLSVLSASEMKPSICKCWPQTEQSENPLEDHSAPSMRPFQVPKNPDAKHLPSWIPQTLLRSPSDAVPAPAVLTLLSAFYKNPPAWCHRFDWWPPLQLDTSHADAYATCIRCLFFSLYPSLNILPTKFLLNALFLFVCYIAWNLKCPLVFRFWTGGLTFHSRSNIMLLQDPEIENANGLFRKLGILLLEPCYRV